jgi:Protein of unknown function (DUF2829)
MTDREKIEAGLPRLNFSQALALLKQGHPVSRAAWPDLVRVSLPLGEDGDAKSGFVKHVENNTTAGWQPSADDMLDDHWFVWLDDEGIASLIAANVGGG